MIGVLRSPKAPEVLTKSTAKDRYRHKDVVDQLVCDFNGKCYICEISPLQSINVEHLRPHKDGLYPERMYDWNNLFLACPHCNNTKEKAEYDEFIIDCCRRDPELLLEQELTEDKVYVGVVIEGDAEAMRTAKLIEEVFMSANPPIRGTRLTCGSRSCKRR